MRNWSAAGARLPGGLLLLMLACSWGGAGDLSLWKRIGGTDSLELFAGGTRLGTLVSGVTVDTATATVLRTTTLRSANLQDPAGGDSLFLDEIRRYSAGGALSGVLQRLTSETGVTIWELVHKGSGKWAVVQSSGGETHREELDHPPGEHLRVTAAMLEQVLERRVEVGDVWVDTLYDVTSLRRVVTTTRCAAVLDPCTLWSASGGWCVELVSSSNEGGLEERLVLDGDARMLFQETGTIFQARRRGSTVPALISSPPWQVKVEEGGTGSLLCLVPGPGVFLDDSIAALYRTSSNGGVALPHQWKLSPPVTGSEDFTAPTPVMQVEHASIQAQARKIAQGAAHPQAFVAAVVNWVFTTLEKRPVASWSNALETLQAGVGDCSEHAVLTAALLRAGGIGARVVLGLVKTSPGIFEYHAWVMVRCENGWVSADPAFGQYPAQKRLAPLVYDDEGRNVRRLAQFIGAVTVQRCR